MTHEQEIPIITTLDANSALVESVARANGQAAFIVHPYFIEADDKDRVFKYYGGNQAALDKYYNNLYTFIERMKEQDIPILFLEGFTEDSPHHVSHMLPEKYDRSNMYMITTLRNDPSPLDFFGMFSLVHRLENDYGINCAYVAGQYLIKEPVNRYLLRDAEGYPLRRARAQWLNSYYPDGCAGFFAQALLPRIDVEIIEGACYPPPVSNA